MSRGRDGLGPKCPVTFSCTHFTVHVIGSNSAISRFASLHNGGQFLQNKTFETRLLWKGVWEVKNMSLFVIMAENIAVYLYILN